MFEQKSQTPLPSLCGERYRGIAYDGCHFYLTARCACCILQLSPCFAQERSFKTRRVYRALCYDPENHCFWATADNSLSALYRLNENFQEVDRIIVYSPDGGCGGITGVSYDCCTHCLLVCFMDGILRVDTRNPCQAQTVVHVNRGWILSVLSVCPYIFCYYLEGSRAEIRIYSLCGELLYTCAVPYDFGLESAVFWPCVKDFCHCHFCVLRTKRGDYPYVCDYVLTCDTLCDNICPCNYELCRPCPCPEPCHDGCEDVLESIAKMESALAHILNAEGEKIQKVVGTSDDTCEILAVNDSVNKVLSKAIVLEQILCCKLEGLSECCDLCTPDKPCE